MVKNIKVYTTPTCPHCQRLKSFLNENSVEYKNIDVSSDREKVKEMVDKSGQMGVPVTDIDGEIIVGFDEEKIRNALDL